MTTNQNTQIRPFTITIPEADLEDLQSRLARTRYAVSAPGDGWEYGTPTSYLQDMVERWKSFDWRAQEARMNAVPELRDRDRRARPSTSCTSARRTRTRRRCCSCTPTRARSPSSWT